MLGDASAIQIGKVGKIIIRRSAGKGTAAHCGNCSGREIVQQRATTSRKQPNRII